MELVKKPSVVAALLALAVGVMLHGNLFGPFYRIDDGRYVPHSVEGAWTDLFKPKSGILYGPVTFLSLRLDRLLFGPSVEVVRPGIEHIRNGGDPATGPAPDWAWGPRLMNGFYHWLAGFFLRVLLTRVGAGAGTALWISFVWTAHPSALESVAWICERKNVLCALFGFAALAAWAGDPQKRSRWVWVTALFTLALFSKLAALSFIPILVALELFDPRKSGSAWRAPGFIKSLVFRMAFIVILAGVVVKLSLGIFKHDIASPPGGSSWTGLLTDSEIFARYTVNTLLPFWLSFFQSVEPVMSLADWRVWIYGGSLVVFWIALLFAAKREDRHWILIGFLWFFGALGPNANIVATAFSIQDRYFYIPMPGLLIAVAFAARGAHSRINGSPKALQALGITFAAFIVVLCAIRSPLFFSSDSAVIDAAERQPLSGFAQLSRAWIYEVQVASSDALSAKPDPQRMKELSLLRAACYMQALKSNDFWMYSSPIMVRTQLAESLFYAEREADVITSTLPMLKTSAEMAMPLDPKILYPELPDAFKYRFRPTMDRSMMGRAWLVTGDSLLKFSYRRDASPQQRMAYAQKALTHSAQALEFTPDSLPPVFLKGKALIRVSYLTAANGMMPEALKAYEGARAVFGTLPKDSPQGKQAEQILKNVPPPEAPKNNP